MLDAKIWRVDSPVTACYRYFSGLNLSATIARDEEPPGWDGSTPLVLIRDGGGNRQELNLRHGRVTVDVRHPEPGGAYDLAEKFMSFFVCGFSLTRRLFSIHIISTRPPIIRVIRPAYRHILLPWKLR